MAVRTCSDWLSVVFVVVPIALVLLGGLAIVRQYPIPEEERPSRRAP